MADEDKPAGLPPIQVSKTKSALDRSRICPKCDQEGRVISNSTGLSVFCNPCKHSWPISSRPLAPAVGMEPVRGLNKQTKVQPDWGMAYDDEIGQRYGPPKKG